MIILNGPSDQMMLNNALNQCLNIFCLFLILWIMSGYIKYLVCWSVMINFLLFLCRNLSLFHHSLVQNLCKNGISTFETHLIFPSHSDKMVYSHLSIDRALLDTILQHEAIL